MLGGCMATQMSKQPPPRPDSEKERRLAEALRTNLRKRKAQAREGKVQEAKTKD